MSTIVFDKSKWHSESADYPASLSPEAACTHMGLIVYWLVSRGMASHSFIDDFGDEVDDVRQGRLSGPELLDISGGTLASDMMTDDAAKFLAKYYSADSPHQQFWDDYAECFDLDGEASPYQVSDTPENAEQFATVLDRRFAEHSRS